MFVIIEHPAYLINILRYDFGLVVDQQKNHAFKILKKSVFKKFT